ncbi:uncharacterized protein LOC129004315 isoform X2 [Macrosteles quadrilineatus]|uniref:uncharacterized protein LOC129004315 isoform X2 n=1 Tax=Macrosteles quadrilineatus TaxID=74068 RepID=UPI0023E0B851|nr:uncharacterized protein LOC129004315 isoform X2 [Macrosteles quadrilineatus]
MLKHLSNGGLAHSGPRGLNQSYSGPGTRVNHNHSNHSHISHNHNHIHSHSLNVSTLSTSKHSLGGSSVANGPKIANGGLHISTNYDAFSNSRSPAPAPPPAAPVAPVGRLSQTPGVREMLTSLGLLCLVSLLLALLSLIFLLRISPVTAADVRELMRLEQLTLISPEEYVIVYEVTLTLCALSLSLNLCCVLVCAVQFIFAVKLVRDSPDGVRTNKFLKKSSITRVCAVGGFFVSIPVFLTGLILYTFIQFHSTPAIVTSILIGVGIVFCGCAMVHNVFVWQKEKTNAVRALAQQQRIQHQLSHLEIPKPGSSVSPGSIPHATLDLSSATTTPHELSTLV